MNNELVFSVANNSVTHLGRNLYSTSPPAIAELIANAYDAYAKYVDVIIGDNHIIVADNGKGMCFEELESKYAIIGKPKENESPPSGMSPRDSMGKKGIGKLAAFSLGDKYTVYTKTPKQSNWLTFSLDYEDLRGSEQTQHREVCDSISTLPQELDKYNANDSGFIVHITNLRRRSTKATFDSLLKQLSRRFYLVGGQLDFIVNVNDTPLDLLANYYYSNLQYLMYFGYSEAEINAMFADDKLVKECFNNSRNSERINYINSKAIKGWIGSVHLPSHLKADGGDYGNIVVYINGKIADEDLLKNKSNARLANNYIVGEISANFLYDDTFDPITSSRQGLDDSLDEVMELIKTIDEIRNQVINRWDSIREDSIVNSLPEKIKTNPQYKNWLDELTPKEKSVNNKLLKIMTSNLDENLCQLPELNSVVTSIASVVNNVEINELEQALLHFDNTSDPLSIINNLMNRIGKQEQIKHAELITARLKAIDQLEKLMDDPSVPEKAFEEHLYSNPWLINPYWNADKNTSSSEFKAFRQKYYRAINPNGNSQRNFIDLLIKVGEISYPIIVELKKNAPTGHALVQFTDMYTQIKKYRQAIKQNNTEFSEIDDKDIPAYFIISEDSGITGQGNKIELTPKEFDMLRDNHIEVLKYSKLLQNAKNIYKEHLSIIKTMNIVPLLD